MSYQPYDRNPSGIVFFGNGPTDQLYESDAAFTIGGGILSATNIKISDGGNIGSATTADAITIASNGKVTLAGDLQVNGTTTTISTTNTVVSDLLLELGNGATGSATSDAGVIIERGDDANVFMGFDESENKFIMGSGVFTGASTGGLSLTKMTLVADLEGDVTGNAATATALASARNFSIIGGVMAAADVSFDGTADVDLTVTAASGLIMHHETETIADGDFLVFSDINDSYNLKKITKANLVGAGGGMTSFTAAGDAGVNQTISDSNTFTFTGGSGIQTVGSNTDVMTFNVKVDDSTIEINSDSLRLKDGGVTEAKRVRTVETITGNTTISTDVTLCNGTLTATLPGGASPASGIICTVKNIGSSVVTIDGGANIDGVGSYKLYHKYETANFFSTGSAWYII